MPEKTDIEIVDEAPGEAVTYCMYDYGGSMDGMYLNCENQFFDRDKSRWVDMNLVDNYFHSHRRIDDIRNINGLTERLGDFMKAHNKINIRG